MENNLNEDYVAPAVQDSNADTGYEAPSMVRYNPLKDVQTTYYYTYYYYYY
ncbi:MAG: hypothetical protein KDK39_18920 [Leptospiraceae bacterium]|nr:hypothetical protein [Leptospiraceae bacterium]